MTVNLAVPAAPPSSESWTVQFNMPSYERRVRFGPPAGTLVGFLNQNDSYPKNVETERRRMWRRSAWAALKAKRLPTGLNRIHIRIELRFGENRDRDQGNYEPTAKPIVDAFQPHREYMRTVNGKPQKVTHWGIGMVPNDTPKHVVYEVVYSEEMIGRDKAKVIGGQVVLTITPLPPLEGAA